MNDLLLKELGKLARSQEEAEKARLDERWDRLAAGTLTAEEETELRALATSSPEAGEAYVAFKPLGAEFQARVVSAINHEPAPAPKPLPFPRVTRWVGATVAVAAAVAVAATVFFRMQGPSSTLQLAYQPPEVTVRSEFRGGEPGRASPGSQVDLLVRPQTAIDGRLLAARGYLARMGSEELLSWQLKSKISEMGVVQLHGTLGKELQPGAWTLWIVIGSKDKLPTVRDLQSKLITGRTRGTDWQAVSKDLLIEASASP
jgi:hypothetical protein